MDKGTIRVETTTANGAIPVMDANVTIEDIATGNKIELSTDESGKTEVVSVTTPDYGQSLDPKSTKAPYSLYNISVKSPAYQDVIVHDVPVFPQTESVVPVDLVWSAQRIDLPAVYYIPPNTLQRKEDRQPEGSSMSFDVNTSVVIPETVRVHLGEPDQQAEDVDVPFIEYIKNVASSEVYPTWPDSALRANIICQIGMVLNRIYTQWYKKRGHDFDITNSYEHDQVYVPGRNIYKNIGTLVDQIFNTYSRRIGHKEPLFSLYCNGSTQKCNGLMQWGTITLANRGYTPSRMIKYYFGIDVELVQTNDIQGIAHPYPGFMLRKGSSSGAVGTIQQQLNEISSTFMAIPKISQNTGYFGEETLAAVRAFQNIFNLAVDGIIGRATWYRIAAVYAAIKRLKGQRERTLIPKAYPGELLSVGSAGENVRIAQQYLKDLAARYSELPDIESDGIFGGNTRKAVVAFQKLFGLRQDGNIGPRTWNKLMSVWNNL